MIKLSDIKLNPQNPRTIKDDKFKKLVKSIKESTKFLEARPIVVKDGVVYGGNMRLRALQELGYTEVPDEWIKDVSGWTAEDIHKFIVVDNVAYGNNDWDLLSEQYEKEELEDWGMDVDKWVDDEVVEDEVPEVTDNPVSKLGEVYQLGRHRLMCGDSTIQTDLSKLLNGVQPTMLFTDPPYGVDYQSRVDEERRKGWGEIKNDQLKGLELQQFLKDSVGIYGQTKYVCCNWQSVIDFWMALGKPNSFIVWDKESIGLGSGYRNQHELILFYGKLNHNSESNVWNIKRDSTSAYTHPTQKPVAISARAIKNSSNDNDYVLDVFGGSGGTLIACEQLNRNCLMMELDPKYCDVIRKRYAKFIGKEDEWQTITPQI